MGTHKFKVGDKVRHVHCLKEIWKIEAIDGSMAHIRLDGLLSSKGERVASVAIQSIVPAICKGYKKKPHNEPVFESYDQLCEDCYERYHEDRGEQIARDEHEAPMYNSIQKDEFC